nr:retrovirus-related Pol polyprotein from transposon TNT 1-94 [Tanacetum cinerariifolium]
MEDHMKKTLKTGHYLKREALRLHKYEDSPKSLGIHKESVQWKKAINKEISSLVKNHTWSLVTLPTGKKALQSKWVFRVKEEQDSSKMLVLSIVAVKDLHLEQLDVKTVFLHGDLNEDIYMTQPEEGRIQEMCYGPLLLLEESWDQEAQEAVVLRIRDEGFNLRKADSRREHHRR